MVLSHGSAVILVTSVRGYSLTPVLQAAQTPLWLCDILRSPGVVGCVFYRVLFYLYRLPHIARWAKAGILHPAPHPATTHSVGETEAREGGSGSELKRGPGVFLPHLAAQLSWYQRKASHRALAVGREGTRKGRSLRVGEGGEGTGRRKGPGGPAGFVGQALRAVLRGRSLPWPVAAGGRCPGLAQFPFPRAFTKVSLFVCGGLC